MAFPLDDSFLVGKARFLDSDPASSSETARIYLKLDAPELDAPFLAQLDTGAAWSAFDPQLAEALNLDALDADAVALSTRFGEIKGHLARTTLRLLADEGDSLDVEATVFVSPDWPSGRNFVAYCGALERVRFAVDPEDNCIYYGVLE